MSVRCVGTGLFPLDERWGIGRQGYSQGMARDMVWLSGLLPYEQASAVYKRIGGRLIAGVSLWRETHRYGEGLQVFAQHRQEQVSRERVVIPGEDLNIRRGVSMDGGMVNIREEGWKELKAGTVFEVKLHRERDPQTHEWVEVPHAEAASYTAVLGSVADFGPALWQLAVEQDVPRAFHSSVTADGAEWIWNLAADDYPDSVQIVDWYHACEHLAQAAHALYPQNPDTARRWFHQKQDDLFKGQIHRITSPLDRADLPDHSRYFHSHKRRMQYQTFREDGYPIGSGTVESAIKQFKTRLTGPGMRWSRPAAEQMLVIRSAVLDHSFDTLWNLAFPLN